MLSLWWIGGPLEESLGRARYLALYFVSGLAGSLQLSPRRRQPSSGASGRSSDSSARPPCFDTPAQLRHASGHRAARDQPDLHVQLGEHRLAGPHRRPGRPGSSSGTPWCTPRAKRRASSSTGPAPWCCSRRARHRRRTDRAAHLSGISPMMTDVVHSVCRILCMPWRTTVLVADLGFPRKGKGAEQA